MPSLRKLFEGLLEAVPDALVGAGTSGDIQFVNHQAELMFGYRRGELLGLPIESCEEPRWGRRTD